MEMSEMLISVLGNGGIAEVVGELPAENIRMRGRFLPIGKQEGYRHAKRPG
jgi:hypothetical protein